MLLLYIMFVEEGQSESGSSVRPNQMLKSFKKMDIELKVISGRANDIKKRKKNAKILLQWLKNKRPDFCYIEPPSGPFFCIEDLKILKRLKELNIPTSLFYRDAYWMYPELFLSKQSYYKKAKNFIIKKMQERDLKVFQTCCQHIFFPTMQMANLFTFKSTSALPPGCELYECNKKLTSVRSNIIYIGGATKHYGVYLLLDAIKELNDNDKKVNLTFICPKEQWDTITDQYKSYTYNDWLNVKHMSDFNSLKVEYENADIAVIPRLNNKYHDFAMPIKLFEYLSFLKPIVSTNCKATAHFIESNKIGVICEDNSKSLSDSIWELLNDTDLYEELKSNCMKTRTFNTWDVRAKEVIDTLLAIQNYNT